MMLPAVIGVTDMQLQNIVIVGAGMMGKGIAQVFAAGDGFTVTLQDIKAMHVLEDIREDMERMAQKGVLPADEIESRMAKIHFTNEEKHDCFFQADIVVECVFEDMLLKQELFARLEEKCTEKCVFATNTSVMSPTEISSKLRNKSRFVGTHFWNPAHLIPLVEVVKSEHTTQKVADDVMSLLLACGKKPVLCRKDVPGFIANRLQHALWREAFFMVQEGIADAATVDEACRYGPGLRWPVMGPMENSDMVGIQLTKNIHDYLLPHLADNHASSPLLQQMLEDGRTGFSAGRGWQDWSEEEIRHSVTKLREYLIASSAKNQI